MDFPSSKSFQRTDSLEVTAPLSPIMLKRSSFANNTELPSSATEFKNRLQQSSAISSQQPVRERKENPTSFIKEEVKPDIKIQSELNQAPPQQGKCLIDGGDDDKPIDTTDSAFKRPPVSLPARLSSDESSKSTMTPDSVATSPLVYIQLDHSQTPTSPTPKPELQATVQPTPSGVVYTQVDPQKTEQLSKKNARS